MGMENSIIKHHDVLWTEKFIPRDQYVNLNALKRLGRFPNEDDINFHYRTDTFNSFPG